MIKNNAFYRDKHYEHLERCQLCEVAAAKHQLELGFRDSWVLDIATHTVDFENQLNKQNTEDAEYHGAVADLRAKRSTMNGLISSAKLMIKTIINDPALGAGDRRMIADIFTSERAHNVNSYDSLHDVAADILTGQQKLVDIGAVWKLPDAVIANLTVTLTAMENAREFAHTAHSEKIGATETLRQMRTFGETLLRSIYCWTIAVWGNDDPRLLEFGFVPKSMISTPKNPVEPE